MTQIDIPFNKPGLTGREATYISEALQKGHLAGDGDFTRRCHQFLERELGCPKVLLTTSCTHALEMSAILLDIEPGDEVIIPAYTFVSTVNAFILRGAKPVFADIRPDTLNLDESRLEELITGRTRAVLPVHYAGVGCEMDRLAELAARYGFAIIEDNAQGLFGAYRGQPLGTFGALSAVSFHETKNFISGEGGALVINDPLYAERAEIIREKGTNRSRFFRGQVDKYTWVDLGSSYLPAEMLAAFLLAQLEARAEITARRRAIYEFYQQYLLDWAAENNIKLPFIPEHCQQPYHMFYLVLPSLEERQRFIAHLRQRGIAASFHYQSLHLSEMGQQWGYQPGDLPITERVSDCLVRLPFFNDLTVEQQTRVVEAVRSFSVNRQPVFTV